MSDIKCIQFALIIKHRSWEPWTERAYTEQDDLNKCTCDILITCQQLGLDALS